MKKVVIGIILIFCVAAVYMFMSKGPDITNAHPSGENIICFGDSLTYGTGASQGMDYPSQLSEMIGHGVINAGVPGDTTKDALERLEKDVLLKSPRMVLITLGGNDLKNRVAKDTTFANLKTIIEAIQATGALVIVGGIDIPLFGSGFGSGYEQVCSDTGAVLVENIYEGIVGHQELMSDPIHPNDRGYRIMAQRFSDAMKPYL